MRTAIIEDEAPARELLRALLRQWPDVEIVGEAADVESGRAVVSSARPELVFLDVQMPGGSGFDVLDAVAALAPAAAPFIVFTTAFDRYALRAFEVSAQDYLLKPFDGARLAKTMTRVLSIDARCAQLAWSRLGALRDVLREPADETVIVHAEGRHAFVRGADIEWIEAVGKDVRFHVKGIKDATLSARESLSSVEARLNARRFIRVRRSAIINRAHVSEVQPWFKGDFVIVLKSGVRIVTGRTFRANVHAMLGNDHPNIGDI